MKAFRKHPPGNHADVSTNKVRWWLDSALGWWRVKRDRRAGELKKVTLVIPTHNRAKYLQRALAYYSPWELGAVIVADSSPGANPMALDRRVQYLHYPDVPYLEKMKDAIGQVETPFVLMAADDDLISVRAVPEAARYLEAHPECACVQGWHAGFIARGVPVNEFHWMALHVFARDYSVDAEHAADRIKQQAGSYLNNYYSLQRSSQVKRLFCDLMPRLPDGLIAERPESIELTQAFHAVYGGSHVVLPMLWISRELLPDSQGMEFRTPSTAKYREKLECVLHTLAEYLCEEYEDSSVGDALSEIAGAFMDYQSRWNQQLIPHHGSISEAVDRVDVGSLRAMVRVAERFAIPQGQGNG